MLSSEEDGPGYAARIFTLQEERFGLAILEAEDFAVASDVQLALFKILSVNCPKLGLVGLLVPQHGSHARIVVPMNILVLDREWIEKKQHFTPFLGRSSRQKRYRRMYAS